MAFASQSSSENLDHITCQIKVFQNNREVLSSTATPSLTFILKPKEFQLEVSPAACSPTIATIPNAAVAKQIGEKPLIYSQRIAYTYAATPSESDILLWWARTEFAPEFRKPPDQNTFAGRQYLNLCKELKYCPNVYPTYSSGHPFIRSDSGSKAVATFKRLDNTKAIEDAKGKYILSVIYTLWRSLPSEYPMADPEKLLFHPIFVSFVFTNKQ